MKNIENNSLNLSGDLQQATIPVAVAIPAATSVVQGVQALPVMTNVPTQSGAWHPDRESLQTSTVRYSWGLLPSVLSSLGNIFQVPQIQIKQRNVNAQNSTRSAAP